MEYSERLIEIAAKAEAALVPHFERIDKISYKNTVRVLNAFKRHRISDAIFAPTFGYGYDDRGRDALDVVWADVFGTEKALVRHNIVNGTHALAIGLFGLLRPGDVMISVTGKPYDTLEEVIGINNKNQNGSLADFGIHYRQIELHPDEKIDYLKLEDIMQELGAKIKVFYVQRSRGYSSRRSLKADEISILTDYIHKKQPGSYVVVDNCYGEFTEAYEPRADLLIGSLIKNPGGGMADTGGYLAGTTRAVELVSYRLTTVGAGGEVGASLGQTKNNFKGLFYAPHTTAQALKTAHFAAYVFDSLGYTVSPDWDEVRADIIQSVTCGSAERLCAFCRGIQSGSPVDSHVTPEPWEMPGYADKVIMAAGTFVQGASIELSADGPLRPPYNVYFQGGLTYESGKIGVMSAAASLKE